jgi:hypothetical protein
MLPVCTLRPGTQASQSGEAIFRGIVSELIAALGPYAANTFTFAELEPQYSRLAPLFVKFRVFAGKIP